MKGKMPRPIKSRDPIVILRTVIRLIKEENKRYDQAEIVCSVKRRADRDKGYFPACGTTACVAGWVNIITGAKTVTQQNNLERAARILKLTKDDGKGPTWPDLFDGMPILDPRAGGGYRGSGQYRDEGPRAHAAAGIRHIKAFARARWGVTLALACAVLLGGSARAASAQTPSPATPVVVSAGAFVEWVLDDANFTDAAIDHFTLCIDSTCTAIIPTIARFTPSPLPNAGDSAYHVPVPLTTAVGLHTVSVSACNVLVCGETASLPFQWAVKPGPITGLRIVVPSKP